MASNFASQMGNSSGLAPVKLAGLCIPGVEAARGAVAGEMLAAVGGAWAAPVVDGVAPSAGSSGLVIVA